MFYTFHLRIHIVPQPMLTSRLIGTQTLILNPVVYAASRYAAPLLSLRHVTAFCASFLKFADFYFVKLPDTFCPTLLLTHLQGGMGLKSEGKKT